MPIVQILLWPAGWWRAGGSPAEQNSAPCGSAFYGSVGQFPSADHLDQIAKYRPEIREYSVNKNNTADIDGTL